MKTPTELTEHYKWYCNERADIAKIQRRLVSWQRRNKKRVMKERDESLFYTHQKYRAIRFALTGKNIKQHPEYIKSKQDECEAIQAVYDKWVEDKKRINSHTTELRKLRTFLNQYRTEPKEEFAEAIRLRNCAVASKWAVDNPHKATQKMRLYHLNRKQASPVWGKPELMDVVYLKCKELNDLWGPRFEVDHLVPLKGKTVCGLHVWWNLQLLDKPLNSRKNCHSWVDMPD